MSEWGFLGAATVADITPPAGLRMGGYVARGEAPALGAHDRLEAVLVWLRPAAGGAGVIWVALDALAVDVEMAAALSRAVAGELGCAADAVHVTATHTHSGPAGWYRDPLGHFTDAGGASRERLVAAVAAAARALPAALEPVTVGFAEGMVDGLGSNRNDPAGPQDRSLGLLALTGERGAPRALLLDHGCHPTVLGHANREWSADWPGAARRTLRDALPGGAIVAVLQGASGDISARFTRRAQTFAEVDRLGALAAAEASDLLAQLEPQAGPVVSLRSQLAVRTRPRPDPHAAAESAAATEELWRQVVAETGPGPAERIARTRHEGAIIALDMAERGLPELLDLPIAVVAIGDLAYVEVPVELFTAPALAIRAASPFRHTRVVTLAGGCFGYVADSAAHEAGVYEAQSSPFDAAGADALVAGALALLERAHAATRQEEPWPTISR